VKSLIAASVGLAIGGPFGGIAGAVAPLVWARFANRKEPEPPLSLVLLLLLVSLRSGMSVLAALIEVAQTVPEYKNVSVVARVARVSGLVGAVSVADERMRPVVAQLARAQRSGASLTGAVVRILESDLAAEKTRRVARARTLPIRLMIPVTLLMLPGLILFMYAPSLLAMFERLTGVLS
jgi:hypothetical protein